MTLTQLKQRKVSILQAMLIVHYLKSRHAKTVEEALLIGWDGINIFNELRLVTTQPIKPTT